jgi:hypothetical protein
VRLFRFFLELDDIVGSKYNIHSVEEQGHIVVMLLHWVQEVGSFPHCDLSKISLFIKKTVGDCGNVPIRHAHLVNLIMERFLCRKKLRPGSYVFYSTCYFY